MSNCPECGAKMTGFRCGRCGYSAGTESKPREHVQCAYEGCPYCATEAKKKGNAIVKLCRQHAEREHMEETQAWLRAKGLNTKPQKEDYRRKISRHEAKPNKEWAHKAIAVFDEGRSSPWCLKLACDVLGVSTDYFLKGGRP